MLTLAGELGVEGREGRPVGTLFVIGDSDRVLAQSHQLVINPFHGYPEGERNILDPRLEETIKEFSAIDGAFIVRGDGVILAAGRYLAPRGKLDPPLPHGLGTRHEAAASITAMTAGPRPVHLAIDGHGLDLQGRPAGHRHPQALGALGRFVVRSDRVRKGVIREGKPQPPASPFRAAIDPVPSSGRIVLATRTPNG